MFTEVKSSKYKVEPVFKKDTFSIYIIFGIFNSPILIEVENYRYVLVEPKDIENNEELLFKIAT